ncbi:c-type cytochrome biogenesis protein CcsB [Macrococcus equipercicus]|uniref:C-type cytochrome biogenesis protein CcsB n=1 Tax=Macrococcus equipercicus TaxID=69967 RepID=A0ABQ6RA31_9STAP|nr:c-type cytochrome biogenesis protein CcsB [Macrococcus equipercicus]KAA1040164.1 c-type cytochrome biogenesis protein CcsB [Macrococcus equipercicus]
MNHDTLLNISSTALYAAFILYLIAIVPFSASIKAKRKGSERIAVILTAVGFIMQLVYFVTRWLAAGHAPVSNMYEFLTMFGIMMVGGFLVINAIYHTPILALFSLPVAMLVIVYASMFSHDVSPLIPALQSNWLAIHVITVTLSYGILSVSSVAGLIYLLRYVDSSKKSKDAFWLEVVMYFIVLVIAFILTTIVMKGIVHYEDNFFYTDKNGRDAVASYHLPALITFKDAIPVNPNGDNQWKETKHFMTGIEVPPVLNAQKLTTVLWSIIIGSILYALIRLIARRTIFSMVKPLTTKVSLPMMDEIGYRSVIIGFPLFALGGILFASIWAQIAWSRFWGWDPKEVWALITFLFYAIFLHLRLGRGWEGKKSAWLAVVGMGIILFNVIAVNLIIAGLHSYA